MQTSSGEEFVVLRMLKTFFRTKREERRRKIQEKLDHDQFMVSFKRIMRYYEWLQTHSHDNDDVDILYLIFEQENFPVTDMARKEIESLKSSKNLGDFFNKKRIYFSINSQIVIF